jgi:hypothetical protein
MAATMQDCKSPLGGGVSGRFWFGEFGFPAPDAILVVTRLLGSLSRSDEPLSAVLDREAAWG